MLPGATEIPRIAIHHIETPIAQHRIRHQGRGRGRRHPAASGHFQRGERCLARAGGRVQ
jgi:hypothetical protein